MVVLLFYVQSFFRVKVLEVSAKDDINIKEIFRSFLTLSRIFPKDADDSGLKRRSSAYVSASKGGRRAESPAPDKERSSSGGGEGSQSLGDTPRAKPRSRSLIRRASRKTKQQIRDAHNSTEECIVS